MDVDCKHVHARLRAGEALDGPLRVHAEACPACSELIAGDAALARALIDGDEREGAEASEAAPELDSLFMALEGEVAEARGPVEGLRQLSSALRVAALALVIVAGAGFVALASPRVDLPVHPLARLLFAAGSLGMGLVLALGVVLHPLQRRRLPRAVPLIAAITAVAAPLLVAALPSAHHAHPESLLGVGDDLVPRAVGCFIYGLGWSLLPLAVLWLLDRSGLRRPGQLALALLAGAAFGNLVLVLHCPLVSPVHKLAGHAPVAVAAVLVAALAWLLRRGPTKN